MDKAKLMQYLTDRKEKIHGQLGDVRVYDGAVIAYGRYSEINRLIKWLEGEENE